MAYRYMDELPVEALVRYKAKLDIVGLHQCPYKLKADEWTNNPKQWPKIEYPDVYHYLINTPGVFSQQPKANHRSLEAYNFFVSGWVQTVLHIKVGTNTVLKADVKPSWRVTEDCHHSWVAVDNSACVLTAHCDCMAGLGESCSHIGALLYKMEAAVRLGYTDSACTDVPCQWNQCFTKKVTPSPVARINFYTEKVKEKVRKCNIIKKHATPATEDEQKLFLAGLQSTGENIVGFVAFSEYNECFMNDKPLPKERSIPIKYRDFYFKEEYTSASDTYLLGICQKADIPPITRNRLAMWKR
ncbi:uncharacterized protein LOC121378072 [Gigantopelta aegis]|uniref:uncharacterized protein LOC121378072 n=1 Tax=Gigantopelta aegis TaxID=1735272 RepID=UPI001B8880B9|nr:uncharacterized protein LOC121378072 [Gigantopelta aegis]